MKVALVGHPNAGKSALFNALSGRYAAVSNYPGTTVEVARAPWRPNGTTHELIDTPGLHGLAPRTEEEDVARRLLMDERPDAVIQVADARNLAFHLALTHELMEAGPRLVLAVTMMDEARELGLAVDAAALGEALGMPVVPCVGTTGEGVAALGAALAAAAPGRAVPAYPEAVERAAAEVAAGLPAGLPFAPKAFALLLLARDEGARTLLARRDPAAASRVAGIADRLEAELGRPVALALAVARQRAGAALAARAAPEPDGTRRPNARERLGDLLLRPWFGLAAAAAVVYLGLYQLVGGFGAGVLVDALEGGVFEGVVNPAVDRLAAAWIPWAPLRDLIGGEYGLITLGVRYAFAVILPMVGTFFLVFALIEDSGYLPRLAHLLDWAFKRIGLSGRAVIPMALGFGCDTMATLVTRTLPTKRERVLATLLLALAIPCSAQLGVILGLLHAHPKALVAWAGFVAAVFVLVGWLGARVLPGGGAMFFMEIPPLRWPRPRNVWRKTFSRVVWYMREVVPLFLLASALIWLGRLTGALDGAVRLAAVPLGWLGLPAAAAPAFIFGFFRRDYGAAGLYDLSSRGQLDTPQLVVATVTLTLFLPCVAQFLIMGRERGWRTALVMTGAVTAAAMAAGATVHRLLPALGAEGW